MYKRQVLIPDIGVEFCLGKNWSVAGNWMYACLLYTSKNLTWQNPEQLFVAQELINKVKSKCCGIKGDNINGKIQQLET